MKKFWVKWLFATLVTVTSCAWFWLTATTLDQPSVIASQSPAARKHLPVNPDSTTEQSLDSANGPAFDSMDGAQPESSLSAEQESLAFFSQLLRDYHSSDLDQDDKISIEHSIRELNASAIGRSLIVDTFFSTEDPELAASLYDLILDADLKDPSLIAALISRDGTLYDLPYKTRIVDLIADLTAPEQVPYYSEIDEYLANLAQHPDPALQQAAKSRRAWYVTSYQRGHEAVLKEYLLDSSPDTRWEMYDLIETRGMERELSERLDTALSLSSLLHADYLGVSAEEEEKIMELIQKLGTDGINL
jgi:hypothetical protein